MGVIMGSSKMVVTVVPVYWILASLPVLSAKSIESTWGYIFLIMSSVFLCNVTMSRGLRRILCLEYVKQMNVKQYLVSTIIAGDSTLLMLIFLFYVQACFYVLLALALDGNICPYLVKLIKCLPCRVWFVKLRRWCKRRKRRRQQKKESEAELKQILSQQLSDITEQKEQLTETVHLYKEKPLRDQISNNSLTPRESIPKTVEPTDQTPNKETSDSSYLTSNSSEENEDRPAMFAHMPEQELLVWLSDEELRRESRKDKATTYYLQQSRVVDQPPDDSEDEEIDVSEIDETSPVVIEFKNVWKKY